jgi:hypothetical protein
MTPERYLYLQFAKALHHGYVRNAVLNPEPARELADSLFEGERCIVAVEDKRQRLLYFTDRRLLIASGSNVRVLFEYAAVRHGYWMDKENWAAMDKQTHFDRLQVEVNEVGLVTLEGLDQAYSPLIQFLWWLARRSQ